MLELCCGTGRLTKTSKEKFGWIAVGVDMPGSKKEVMAPWVGLDLGSKGGLEVILDAITLVTTLITKPLAL